MDATGQAVDPKAHVEPGTGLALACGWTLLVVLGLIAVLTIYIALIVVIGLIVDYFQRKKIMAMLRGSSIAVGPNQFPEIHRCAEQLAGRLGMRHVPEVFIAEGNAINAAAANVSGRKVIVLMDDIVDACLRSGDTRTLTFILAHEMAHHALGHTDLVRGHISRILKWLSRLDEFTCDRVAYQLTGDPHVAVRAMALLTTGPQLMPFLNLAQLAEQAREVDADKHARRAERKLTHPLLLRRMRRFLT
jgi:Zn-dependent protease with chaperone function